MTNKIKLKKKTNIFNKMFKDFSDLFLPVFKLLFLFVLFICLHVGSFILAYNFNFFNQWAIIYLLLHLLYLLSLKLIGIYKSEKLPIDDEEANQLNIHNIRDYLYFVRDYMSCKIPIILRPLFFCKIFIFKLYLTNEHLDYIEKLIKKEYGNDAFIDFANVYLFENVSGDLFCNLHVNDKSISLFFNDKYVKSISSRRFGLIHYNFGNIHLHIKFNLL
jgi:hypothetical protein